MGAVTAGFGLDLRDGTEGPVGHVGYRGVVEVHVAS